MKTYIKMNPSSYFISTGQYRIIKNFSIACYPREACGLLGLKIGKNGLVKLKIILTTNVSKNKNSFQISKNNYSEACKMAKMEGLVIAGCFHSHPIHIASPSSRDILLSKKKPNELWLIYSVKYDEINLYFMSNLPSRKKLIIS